jgi:hypothetical protein
VKQTLFIDDDASLRRTPLISVPGGAKKLTKTQKRFNRLVEQINAQREAIAHWQAYRDTYQKRLAADYQPLATRMRERRIALVELLDRIMDSGELGQRHRAKVRDILDALLSGLLAEAEDPALIVLYDKYADFSFADAQQQRIEAMRAVAAEALGIDVDDYEGGDSPEDLADWIDEQVRAAHAEPPPASKPRRKSVKADARATAQTEVAAGGSRALRDIFRKLASALHPDREHDVTERARKTELMKELNQAYAERDLLQLLELQIRVEQIDDGTLTGLDEDRLRHYVHVLEERAGRLQEELVALVQPFALSLGGVGPRGVTPDAVARALEADIRDLKDGIRAIEEDLVRFRDVRILKQNLAGYRIASADDDDDDWPTSSQGRAGRRRSRR